jgi:hypothetical protein
MALHPLDGASVIVFYIVWLVVAAGILLGGLAVRVVAGAEAPQVVHA